MEEMFNGGHPVRKERRGKERSRREKQRNRKDDIFSNDNGNHNLTWSNQSMMPPHRMLASGDASFTPYPVHVSYPLEPYQFSLFPSVYPVQPPAPFCPVPPARKGRKGVTCVPSKRNDTKQMPRVAGQQYASLPPVNFDTFSPKSSDSDSNSKRHYSDPGVGPASSDESDNSCSSLANPMYLNLIEEVRDLKEKCHLVTTELATAKQELRELKSDGCSKCSITAYQPGSIADAVSELRLASQAREEAIFSKVNIQLNSSADHQSQKLSALTERLTALEEKFDKFESHERKERTVCKQQCEENAVVDVVDEAKLDSVDQLATTSTKLPETSAPDAFTMLKVLKDQKLELERELQQAVHVCSEAEANTQKLERLVAILRKKINGLSAQSCIPEELQAQSVILTFERQNQNVCEYDCVSTKVESPDINTTVSFKTEPAPVVTKINGTIPLDSKTTVSDSSPPNLTSAKPNSSPPIIPPRPVVFSPAHRPKTSPPLRPPTATSASPPHVVQINSHPEAKFCIGKPVSSPVGNLKKIDSETSTETSSEGLSPGPSSLGATLTISGPVTDL